MKEIENTRSQIQLSDLLQFDERIKPVQDEVQAGVNSFREVQKMYTREKADKEPKRAPTVKTQNSGNVNDEDAEYNTRNLSLVHFPGPDLISDPYALSFI